MNESEGDSQKWSNSPGYSTVMNSPFKTPLSAKGGRASKSKVSKEGRSCPPTPISNAGQKIFLLSSVNLSSLVPHLKSFQCLETAYVQFVICFFIIVPEPQYLFNQTISDDMQVPRPRLLLLVAVVMTVPQVILKAMLINKLFTFHLPEIYD